MVPTAQNMWVQSRHRLNTCTQLNTLRRGLVSSYNVQYTQAIGPQQANCAAAISQAAHPTAMEIKQPVSGQTVCHTSWVVLRTRIFETQSTCVSKAAAITASCACVYLGERSWLPYKLLRVGGADISTQQALAVHLVIHMHPDHIHIACHSGQFLHQGCLATACRCNTSQ